MPAVAWYFQRKMSWPGNGGTYEMISQTTTQKGCTRVVKPSLSTVSYFFFFSTKAPNGGASRVSLKGWPL